MKETLGRCVIATTAHEGAKQRILTQLERAAPPELADALDDLSFADTLLRSAVRTDVISSPNWVGQRADTVTSNLDGIAAARDAIAKGDRDIRGLAHDGTMPTDAMVARMCGDTGRPRSSPPSRSSRARSGSFAIRAWARISWPRWRATRNKAVRCALPMHVRHVRTANGPVSML
jgi:hypothetical protein